MTLNYKLDPNRLVIELVNENTTGKGAIEKAENTNWNESVYPTLPKAKKALRSMVRYKEMTAMARESKMYEIREFITEQSLLDEFMVYGDIKLRRGDLIQ